MKTEEVDAAESKSALLYYYMRGKVEGTNERERRKRSIFIFALV